ncbi:putative phage-like tail fiber protein [Haemophilus parainfluenzae]|uniref:Putative phage-like tail fiber protein n=1 Tax=Haemophilus parainfluenzae TaxID=729 RepID=A0A448Q0A7_HAEPA|nr:phage tail protein [Haemophilus parainfluenzae]VEI30286.1 putative phage-like tail fiber protein [Haemophilus parainfluenzae]
MANLKEQEKWEDGVYQIEENDPVLGGENGITNKPIKQLSNRTLWLKKTLELFGKKSAPKDLTADSTSTADESGHSHKLPAGSITQKGIWQATSDTGIDSDGLVLTAKAGKKLAQLIATVQLALNNYIPLSKRSSAVNSNDENNVATSKAVKTAYDKGVDAKNAADNAQRAADNANNNANTRVAKSGDTMTGNLTVPNLIVNDPTNNNNFVQIGDDTKLIDVDMGQTVGLQTTGNANDAYIAYGATKKRFGFDGANFSAESGLGAQWFGSQKRGEGAYSQQWQTEAPYHVNAGNANGSNTYFPYLKGKVLNGDGWGSAFSFGYTTPGARNQFGAGIIHLIEDNGREKWWEFAHNGNFRSAADVVTGSGKSLNNTHQQSYDYVQVTSSGHYGGLSILKPDGKSMRFEREGNAFKFWNQDMYSILMPERGGTVLLDTDFFYQKIGNFEIRKYPDGTMIQTNTVNFRGGYSHGTVYSFNWAVSFVAAPMVFGNGKAVEDYRLVDRFQMDIKTKSNGSTYYYYLYDPGGEQGDWDMQFLAIGRWK